MSFVPNTDDNRKEMLNRIGVKSIEDIFAPIPSKARLARKLDIPANSELEVLNKIDELASKNLSDLTCFAGGGIYDHFIPAALDTIISRPEFMTAYTPYQAEVSQGTLQVIYEFQSHICRLTGMDVANASMYDGATAAAEAVVMAMNVTKRDKVVISETVSPLFRKVIDTYLSGHKVEIVTILHKDGMTDFNKMSDVVDEKTAAVVTAQPNFFGLLEDANNAADLIHRVGGKFILAIDPITQALLKTPADLGADIVIGEGQPLGIPVSFGGPLLGFFAAKLDLIRFMPGRIASRTIDVDNKVGYVLTLQTREQHIRREKATSNICTNQALCATAAAVYMTLMGKSGLKQAALLSAEKAQKAQKLISEIDGFEPFFKAPFVREFVVKTPKPAKDIINEATKHNLLIGIDAGRWYKNMDNCLIMAFTEKRTDNDIIRLINSLKEYSQHGVLSGM